MKKDKFPVIVKFINTSLDSRGLDKRDDKPGERKRSSGWANDGGWGHKGSSMIV